jgi:hypothetical protein
MNGAPDFDDIATGASQDCDLNGNPDECDGDCNSNGTPDTCDIVRNPGLDCDGDAILDSCEIASDSSLDCNGSGTLDICDLALDPGLDCDGNGDLDTCEIAGDGTLDQNTNGVLDTCECITTNYCLAAGNSAGTNAIMGWQGSTPITNNDFTLTVTGAPPLKFGVFFYGAAQSQVFLGEGMLCVAAPVQRIQPVLLTDQQGAAVLPLDFTLPPFSTGPFAVSPLSTWNFQFWYRDPLGGPAGFNFSDGLEVTFCP